MHLIYIFSFRMKNILLLIFFLLCIFGSVSAQSSESNKYISLEPYYFHLAYLKADSAMMIDVREYFEFKGKKIRDAVNMPSTGNLEFAADTLSHGYSLFFYCTTDYRSRKVAEYFSGRGFPQVYNLEGGIAAWRKDGFPVTRKKSR